MNEIKYFDEFDELIENMSDEEFESLLIEAGLKNCPLAENQEDNPINI
ncbi:MAG: hypothetical protein LKF87_10060 [Clostridium tyrobutyricum]|jgi:hypothetical protein|nr:hypothetical protein [Clostridium tyrobutyricum]MCH4201318.1 hypothetical protein [Clostridium tyrobutyricum]MCH4259293.1 hypothetical protein [Clostridium tyrobutyricum]